ncbi:putative F-box protein At3g22710 isoform X2 [Papaver somniferum]|uniref:putative F-box protein At3g22710 isoform X2 n=1 Tax=Papaver somniferum TaxID=3469 RepID=UPI000E6FCAE6|nr:putative F-box protein At3g22710 isoform X2 [Papaver somniferum]
MGRINNLPKEIMSEILSRLPTESVLDCKLVCKRWLNVVLHPSFSHMHFNRLDSAVCLNASYKGYYGPAYICNPITREYILLPISKRAYQWTGFGYIPSTSEYKVVRISVGSRDLNAGNIQVYTLGSGFGWRNVGNTDIEIDNFAAPAGAFANGALHRVNKREGTVLAFHLTNEKFIELPSPPCLTAGVSVTLKVLGNFLSATSYHNASSCEIWLLKKNKDNCDDLSWSKDFSFDVFDNYKSWPFCYTKCGRLLFYGDNNISSYHPKDSSAKMDVSFGKTIVKGIPHKNTLVSLKVLGEKNVRTMESSEGASSSEQTENKDQLKKPQNEVRDL